MEGPPGSGDCEQRLEVWGQPVLLGSSAAYVVAAVFVFWWSRRRGAPGDFTVFALGLLLTGLGSMDYHGPALGPEPQLHDAGLALALIAAAVVDLRTLGLGWRPRGLTLAVIAALTLLVIVVIPAATPALAAVAALALVAVEALVYRRGLRRPTAALWAALVSLGVGVVIFSLSRTGGPLCEPDSLVQGHAIWHVLTALALALWAVAAIAGEESQ